MIGISLNHYRITASIGAGGMGEVFRARDTRLNRDVAVKVLPKDFVADADRLRRFEQEARTLAALNHPNVLTVHDAGIHEGTPYLVSELLEGKTLREEMNPERSGLPVRKAAEYALQIAHGLAAAHGKGVIHRDLKPENIFTTKDGRVKILDFGLAKLRAPVAVDARRRTSTSAASTEGVGGTIRIDEEAIVNTTEPGMVFGTPAYMSPEQVRGEPADHRSDIFAFGAVLYEMLSGTRAFRRDTPIASMNAVLAEEPPELSREPTHASIMLARVVERCLAKQPENRFQSARDLAFAIQSVSESPRVQSSGRAIQVRRLSRPSLVVAAAAVLVVVAFLGGRMQLSQPTTGAQWQGQRLGGPTIAFKPTASPDGKELAFTPMENNVTQLGVMVLDSGDWRVLTTNRILGNVGALCWSRDGTELFYERWSGTSLGIYRVSKMGGDERRIIDNGEVPQMLADGSLLLLRAGKDRLLRLHRCRLGDQNQEPLNAVTGYSQFGHRYRILPGDKEVIFHGWPSNSKTQEAGIWLLNLETDQCRLLSASPPRALLEWAASPHIPDRYGRFILSVDTVGDGYRIVRRAPDNYARAAPLLSLTLAPVDLDTSPDGSMYVSQVERPVVVLRFNSSNKVERLPLSASYGKPDILPLPGGSWLLSSHAAGKHRLVVMSRDKEAVPLLSSRDESRGPVALLGRDRVLCMVRNRSNWVASVVSIVNGHVLGRIDSIPADQTLRSLVASPDGRTIYYVAAGSIWSAAADGGPAARVRAGDSIAIDPNGAFLLVQVNQPETNQLVQVPSAGGPEKIVATQYSLTGNPLSSNAINRDGRVLVQVALPDSWYWPAAILDLETGTMNLVPEESADMNSPGWDEQSRIVAAAAYVRSSLWRFRPEN